MRDSRFTEQEIGYVRETDAAALAETMGYTVKRLGSWRTREEAQHIRIKGNRYYDNYQQKWGDAITFLQDFGNLSFVEAVRYLKSATEFERSFCQSSVPQAHIPLKSGRQVENQKPSEGRANVFDSGTQPCFFAEEEEQGSGRMFRFEKRETKPSVLCSDALAYHGYERESVPRTNDARKTETPEKQAFSEEPVAFALPEANEDNRRVFGYLRKRGIDAQGINTFIAAGLLYEGREYHNCVFVGREYAGKLRKKYEEKGYTVHNPIPPKGKDWNEYLQSKKKVKMRGRNAAR